MMNDHFAIMERIQSSPPDRVPCSKCAPGAWSALEGVAGIVFLAGLFLAGCSTAKKAPEPQELTVSVEVANVLTGTIQLKVTSNGVLYPLNQAAIVPKISAPVKKFYVDRGSAVHAGQLLAELENQDLAGSVAENQGSYDTAQATYETAVKATLPEEIQKAELDVKADKEALDAQEKIYESRQALYKQGAISAKEVSDALVSVTQARNAYEIAQKHLEGLQGGGKEQEIKAASGQLAAAKGRYQSAEAQMTYSKVVSPINGVVTDRPLYPGEMAQSGSPILTVMDLSQVIARTHISQQDAALLKAGDPATLSIPGQAGDTPGKVTLVSPALDPNSTTVEVWVQAANPGARLKPGASVRVEIVANTVNDTFVIPEKAILTSASGTTSVMVVDAQNKPHKKPVKLGIHEGDEVQVTEGLASGERVVTVGAFELDKEDEDVLAKTKVQVQTPLAPEEEDEDK